MENQKCENSAAADTSSEKPSRLNSIVRNIILGLEGTTKGQNNTGKPTEKEILGKLKEYLSLKEVEKNLSEEKAKNDWIIPKVKDDCPKAKPSKTLMQYFGSPTKTKNLHQNQAEDVEDFLEDVRIEPNWRPITVKECWTPPGNSKPKSHHGGPLSGITRSMVSKAALLRSNQGKVSNSGKATKHETSGLDEPEKPIDNKLPQSANSRWSDTLSIVSSHSSTSLTSSTLSYLDRHGYLRTKFTHFGKCTTFLTGLIFGILLILVPVIIVDTNGRITGRDKVLCSCPVASGYHQPNDYNDNSIDELNKGNGNMEFDGEGKGMNQSTHWGFRTTVQPILPTKTFATSGNDFRVTSPRENEVNNDIDEYPDKIEQNTAPPNPSTTATNYTSSVTQSSTLIDQKRSTASVDLPTILISENNFGYPVSTPPSSNNNNNATTLIGKFPIFTNVVTPEYSTTVNRPYNSAKEGFFTTIAPKSGYTETHSEVTKMVTPRFKNGDLATNMEEVDPSSYTETLEYPEERSEITIQNQIKENDFATTQSILPTSSSSTVNLTQEYLYTSSPASAKTSTSESNEIVLNTFNNKSVNFHGAEADAASLKSSLTTSTSTVAQITKVTSSSIPNTEQEEIETTTTSNIQANDLFEPTLSDQEIDYLENLIDELKPGRNRKGRAGVGEYDGNPTSPASTNTVGNKPTVTTTATTKSPSKKEKPPNRKVSEGGKDSTASNGDDMPNVPRPKRKRAWWQRFINAVENAINKINPFKRKNGVLHIVVE